MTTITTNQIYTNGSMSSNLKHLNDWLASFQDRKIPSTVNNNPKLNSEIHFAIIKEPSEYVPLICDHLFTLHHDVQQRPFVLQFLPSFVTTYYDVLYHHHHLESIDVRTKGVTDDGNNEKIHEFRIPNLTLPSIYHTPNPDHYAPTPLTQHAISKHDTKCEVIRLQSFTPFDSVNGITREQILWFLLIQYGHFVSSMDKYSQQSYIQMSKKLLGQGFSFNRDVPLPTKMKSVLPPTGRRIHVSSRIMSEILGTLFYFKSNSTDNEASDCMRLLKQRAEYEMYADVILMTESLEYLHEFESQRPEKQETMGIEIESAPTIDIVRQKRTATTTRSIKTRQRSSKQHEITVLNENNINVISPSSPTQKQSLLTVTDENSNEINHSPSSPMIDQARTNISSSIGPIISTPSPSSSRHCKPVSLESTKTYFNTIQQHNTSPILQARTLVHDDEKDENKESITILTLPDSSNKKHGKKNDLIATVKFTSDTSDENESIIEETYL